MSFESYFEANRRNWDERVSIHVKDAIGFYGVDAFLAGGDGLHAIEAAEIGDVSGLRLAHLQCHFGLDTLALARRGADVTGLDFSPSAIVAARDLAARTGLRAAFVEGNVYDARRLLAGDFDRVYVTWGAIGWLPDIGRWAETVAALLKSDGRLYLAEGHPFMLALAEEEGRLVVRHPYGSPPNEPFRDEEAITYTGDPTPLENRTAYWWNHPLSDIFSALTAAGLRIETFREHDRIPWKAFPMMVPDKDERLWRLPESLPSFPLALSLKAAKMKERA